MSMLPISMSDLSAFAAAAEAVAGLTAQGKPVTEEAVRHWLGVVFGAPEGQGTVPPELARAMHFAKRMIEGPKPR